MEQDPSVDEPMHNAESHELFQDEDCKKSFKRKYRKLLNKYLTIRANNQTLHQTYQRAIATAAQLSNENAYILDYLLGLNPNSPPPSPPYDEDFDPPLPETFNRDVHFGYSPTPDPPIEIATQLTKEQIALGMFKVDGNSSSGTTGLIQREEESVEVFKARVQMTSGETASGSGRRGSSRPSVTSTIATATRRKRKDRESDVDDNPTALRRKKGRG